MKKALFCKRETITSSILACATRFPGVTVFSLRTPRKSGEVEIMKPWVTAVQYGGEVQSSSLRNSESEPYSENAAQKQHHCKENLLSTACRNCPVKRCGPSNGNALTATLTTLFCNPKEKGQEAMKIKIKSEELD